MDYSVTYHGQVFFYSFNFFKYDLNMFAINIDNQVFMGLLENMLFKMVRFLKSILCLIYINAFETPILRKCKL